MTRLNVSLFLEFSQNLAKLSNTKVTIGAVSIVASKKVQNIGSLVDHKMKMNVQLEKNQQVSLVQSYSYLKD